MSLKLNRVILGSDYNPQFLNFWPLASSSWVNIFSVRPTLALVSDKPAKPEILAKLRKFGDVYYFVSTSKAPLPNQAKMIRWFLACQFQHEVVSIEDIDTIYLKPEYLKDRLAYFQDGKLLGIGDDVDQNNPEYIGKFPASNLTGTGESFRDLFLARPDESFEDFLLKFKNFKIFDDREDPFNPPKAFSDESLIRALRSVNKTELVITVPRLIDIHEKWMDRSWWPSDNRIPEQAILANLLRPLYNNRKKCSELIQLHFPNEYPWMIRRRSYIWENPDSTLRRRFSLIRYRLQKIRNMLSYEINGNRSEGR